MPPTPRLTYEQMKGRLEVADLLLRAVVDEPMYDDIYGHGEIVLRDLDRFRETLDEAQPMRKDTDVFSSALASVWDRARLAGDLDPIEVHKCPSCGWASVDVEDLPLTEREWRFLRLVHHYREVLESIAAQDPYAGGGGCVAVERASRALSERPADGS